MFCEKEFGSNSLEQDSPTLFISSDSPRPYDTVEGARDLELVTLGSNPGLVSYLSLVTSFLFSMGPVSFVKLGVGQINYF